MRILEGGPITREDVITHLREMDAKFHICGQKGPLSYNDIRQILRFSKITNYGVEKIYKKEEKALEKQREEIAMSKERTFLQLGQAKKKNETAKGCWVECTIYPSEEKKDLFFPYASKDGKEMIRVVSDDEVWVWDWLLGQKEKEHLQEDEGVLVE